MLVPFILTMQDFKKKSLQPKASTQSNLGVVQCIDFNNELIFEEKQKLINV